MDECRFDENGLIKRPDRRDGCVRRRAAELALPEVKRWSYFEHGGDALLIKVLMKHIGGSDGYTIAKDLEREGWDSDAGLVDALDANHIGTAEREIVAQWVICLGVKLPLPIGAAVTYRDKEGVIVGYYPESAQYGVRTPEQKETSNLVCNAEEVTLVAEVKAA